MTLSTKPHYKEEKKLLLDKELIHRLNTDTAILIALTSCIGVATAIIISPLFELTPPSLPTVPSVPSTDLGSVTGFVMSSNGLPVEGATVVIHKHMGLIYSADKNAGYIDYVITE